MEKVIVSAPALEDFQPQEENANKQTVSLEAMQSRGVSLVLNPPTELRGMFQPTREHLVTRYLLELDMG